MFLVVLERCACVLFVILLSSPNGFILYTNYCHPTRCFTATEKYFSFMNRLFQDFTIFIANICIISVPCWSVYGSIFITGFKLSNAKKLQLQKWDLHLLLENALSISYMRLSHICWTLQLELFSPALSCRNHTIKSVWNFVWHRTSSERSFPIPDGYNFEEK